MSVKKKFNLSVESFIDRGSEVKGSRGKGCKSILVRFPREILDDLDSYLLLNKRWVNRTQWIVEAVHEKLKKEIEEIK